MKDCDKNAPVGSPQNPIRAHIVGAIEQAISLEFVNFAVEKAKAEKRNFISCGDFESVHGFPGCCSSCHEDEEYDDLIYNLWDSSMEPVFQGMQTHFCCKIAKWILAALPVPR